MRMSLSRAVALAGALGSAASAGGWLFPGPTSSHSSFNDPYKPRPRSKGEKARNRRNRP